MKKIWIMIMVFVVGNTATIGAFAGNVYSTKENDYHFVKVTTMNDTSVKFEFCLIDSPTDCHPLGNKDFYTIRELRAARKMFRLGAIGVGALDVVIVAGAAVTGAVGGFVLLGGSLELAGSAGAVFGVIGGVAISSASVIKWLNPFTRFVTPGRAMSDKMILREGDVLIKSSIYQFRDDLENFLKRMD